MACRSVGRRPNRKLALNTALRAYVEGETCQRRHGPERRSRPWSCRSVEGPPAWSAKGSEIGSGLEPDADCPRLQFDFPDDMTMRISHEAIYQALFVQGREVLRRELNRPACRNGTWCCGCRGRACAGAVQGFVSPEIMLTSVRPKRPIERCRALEGDRILGSKVRRSARWSSAPRASRCCCLVPALQGMVKTAHEERARARGDTEAEAVRDAITRASSPCLKNWTVRWLGIREPNGQHDRLKSTRVSRLTSAICEAHGGDQRENTYGLLRQYFPIRYTDLSVHSADAAVAAALNARPRRTRGWSARRRAAAMSHTDRCCYYCLNSAATTGAVEVQPPPSESRVGHEFFRVHPDDILDTTVFIDEKARDLSCSPQMRGPLVGEARPVLLVPAISRQNVLFIWPVPLPRRGRSAKCLADGYGARAVTSRAGALDDGSCPIWVWGLQFSRPRGSSRTRSGRTSPFRRC